MSKRNLEEVLWFRTDIAPFLTHLTRDKGATNAKDILEKILTEKKLKYDNNCISDAKFGMEEELRNSEIDRDFFSAISFTETPLNEIHSLLEIKYRNIDLQPYGIVFLKDKLVKKEVSPVIYLNNQDGTKIKLVEALCTLQATNSEQAKKILPYIAVFGKKLLPIAGTNSQEFHSIDFSWEREWRYASQNQTFQFTPEDIFIGLCPHEKISDFEKFTNEEIKFIDPQRNIKWYAEKLVERRRDLRMPHSVV